MSPRVAQRYLLIQLIQLYLINSSQTHPIRQLNNLQPHLIPAYSSKTPKLPKTSAALSFLATLGLAILLPPRYLCPCIFQPPDPCAHQFATLDRRCNR
ncbi:uncharacterized protein K441DRAFT_662989 [Cenococcum geophilum 1.58]|uniref:uncharacterized protein n=1 Tax=Cenococcum geophilum 1.58 TaxID=794803 RepID=UPI00358E6C71|nr:hypothetical protein K441DRAFT_662989 [Cenococcum geophilum 1.58]